MTNKQILLVGAIMLAAIALLMGCPLMDVVRALSLMLGMGV